MMPSEISGFRVVIVGAGIAGLTLANSLQHAGIEFLILEARSEIAPRFGASIGLSPNGSRILDQLSCYDQLERFAEPVRSVGYHDASGNELCPRSDGLQLILARTNYPIAFLERRKVIEVLAKHIRNKKRIILDKKVEEVQHFPDRVIVKCTDGTSYCGDIVAGADGIRSEIRREMWREAKGKIPTANKRAMSAEYMCVFGISSNLPALSFGHLNVTHKKNVSTLVINGKGGEIFWFLFVKMPKTYRGHEIPRFSESDAAVLAQQHLDLPILPKAIITFGDLWQRRSSATLLALEEADYPTWTWGRFACVGDSAHKMTPNMGAGGMAAIESAAVLANCIHSVASKRKFPTLEEIQNALAQYQEERKHRASQVVKASNQLTRIQAIQGLKELFLVHVGIPYSGDYLVHAVCADWIGAPLLHFLPPPSRSLTASMPLDPFPVPMGSTLCRAIKTIPLLVLSIACYKIPIGSFSMARDTATNDVYSTSALKDLPNQRSVLFSSFIFLDDPLSQMQTLTFLADIGLIYSILLVESTRRANSMSPARFPLIFGIAFFANIGVTLPIYYLLHYLFCPVAYFRAADYRLTDISYTTSIFPTVMIGFYIPYSVAYLFPKFFYQRPFASFWFLFPLWISLGQWFLSWTIMPRSLQYDRLYYPTRDIGAIRTAISIFIVISASIHLCYISSTEHYIVNQYFPFHNQYSDVTQHVAMESLQRDQFYFSASSFLWIMYLFAELRSGGFIVPHWAVALVFFTCASAAFGAGAATAVIWLWREEILVKRKFNFVH